MRKIFRTIAIVIALNCYNYSNAFSNNFDNDFGILAVDASNDSSRLIGIQELQDGHVYNVESSIHGWKSSKNAEAFHGFFDVIALPAGSILAGEEFVSATFNKEHNSFHSSSLTTDKEYDKIRLPWWPLTLDSRLLGWRFGLEGSAANRYYKIVQTAKGVKWVEDGDDSVLIGERIMTMLYGRDRLADNIGWQLDRTDSMWKLIPRARAYGGNSSRYRQNFNWQFDSNGKKIDFGPPVLHNYDGGVLPLPW